MKKQVSLEYATRIINNGPLVVVGTRGQEWDDFAPVAWTMPTSKSPATITLCIGPSHETWKNIVEKKEFTCNIPGLDLIREVAFFGGVSAANCNKIEITGVEVNKAKDVNAPVLSASLACLECRVISIDESTHLVKAEIVSAYADEKAFGDHWKLADGCFPLHHLGGKFYECAGKEYVQERLKNWD